MSKPLTIAVIGGGAAGFFGAIACAELNNKNRVILIEKARQVLSKVRISGGGRCNVTHACFDPAALIKYYPRGGKELRGPFSRFQPRDTVEWFESSGVPLKEESDGRIFPQSNTSESIINCLLEKQRLSGVELWTEQGVADCKKNEDGFELILTSGKTLYCDRLLVATGSAAKSFSWLKGFGHTPVSPVPSLFTFNVPTSPLLELAGVSVPKARVLIEGTSLDQTGPLLITHFGFSGPAVLKASAWGARILHDMNYQAALRINWLPDFSAEELKSLFSKYRKESAARQVATESFVPLSKNLWRSFLKIALIPHDLKWAAISNQQIHTLVTQLQESTYRIDGKTTYKEEFVTCGGIALKEVDFKTMESRLCKGLYFAGEILDIDGVTGGFNFQNAWTTSWIAGRAMAVS